MNHRIGLGEMVKISYQSNCFKECIHTKKCHYEKNGGFYDIWKTGATAIYDISSLIYMLHVIDALVGCDDVWN